MKFIILVVIWFFSFVFFFLLFSTVGMLWTSYCKVISEGGWIAVYTIFIGSWLAVFPAREYYVRNKDHFNKYS